MSKNELEEEFVAGIDGLRSGWSFAGAEVVCAIKDSFIWNRGS